MTGQDNFISLERSSRRGTRTTWKASSSARHEDDVGIGRLPRAVLGTRRCASVLQDLRNSVSRSASRHRADPCRWRRPCRSSLALERDPSRPAGRHSGHRAQGEQSRLHGHGSKELEGRSRLGLLRQRTLAPSDRCSARELTRDQLTRYAILAEAAKADGDKQDVPGDSTHTSVERWSASRRGTMAV
jgi:hypothetical protein